MLLAENIPFVAVLIESARDAPEETPCFFVPSEQRVLFIAQLKRNIEILRARMKYESLGKWPRE